MFRFLNSKRIKSALSALSIVLSTSLSLVAAPQVETVEAEETHFDLSSLALIVEPLESARTWKSSDGAYSIDAEYVGAKDGKVSLRKKNGAVIEVPLARLSAEDQAYVEDITDPFREVEQERGAKEKAGTKKTFLEIFREVEQENAAKEAAKDRHFPAPESRVGAVSSDTAKYFPPVEYSADSYDPSLSVDELNQRSGNAITSPEGRRVPPLPPVEPTFGSRIDDPLGLLVVILFCISIFAGVFIWISKQRSGHETERDSEKAIAMLDRKSTTPETTQISTVPSQDQSTRDADFELLNALNDVNVQEIIGAISSPNNKGILGARRMNGESVDSMPFQPGNAPAPQPNSPFHAPGYSPPTLFSTHSNNSSSDGELESLKKKNEELKRKVEAKKLAEKQAEDKAALGAENARLMQQQGEGTVSSDRSSDVRPSNVANRNLADRKISGVGGWLALLVASMLVLGLLLSIKNTGSNIWVAEMQTSEPKNDTWETVSIPGICTFQIPSTVELQKGAYRKFNDIFRKTVLEIETTPDFVVAQPKGINDFDPAALKRYCRVIVETARRSKGDFAKLDARMALSAAEMKEFEAEVKNQVQQGAELATSKGIRTTILSWRGVKITQVNGVDALLTTYTRSVNDASPVLVSEYKIQNNDCLHTITISYRESESNLWAADLGKVIGTFKFKKR